MQKSFDKSSLENQNLGSLSNRIAQISRVNADFLSPFSLMAFEAYSQALDGVSKFMAVCGNGNVHA